MTTARVGVDITARDGTSGAFLSVISNVNRLAKATQGFGDRQRNMAFQVNDIFAQLSTGTNPMTVLLQQGPQIAQIYGFGNGGVAAAFRDVGNMVLSVAKKVGPWAALAGAAAAAVTYEVNRVSGETYSMGEVFSATIDVISESITATLMPVIKGISPITNSVLDTVMGKVRGFGNLIIGVNLAWLEVVKRGLSELPDLFKYFGGLAANFFVQQIEGMINAVTGLLNRFASGINRIFEMLPESLQPGKLGQIPALDLSRFKLDTGGMYEKLSNPFKGLGTDLGAIVGRDYIGGFASAVGSQAAKNRIAEALKNAKPGSGKSAAAPRGKLAAFDELSTSKLMPLADGLGLVEDRFEALQTVADSFTDKFMTGFDAVIDRTKSLKHAFRDTMLSMARDAASNLMRGGLQTLLMGASHPLYGGGSGGILSALGGIFGGFRAKGGPVVPGKIYMTGEKGPEPFIPSVPGHILPNDVLSGGGNASGGVNVTYAPVQNFSGGVDAVSQRRFAREMQAQWRRDLPALLADAQKRAKI